MSTWYTALKEYFPANEMKSKEHFDLLLKDKGSLYKVEEGPEYVLVYFEEDDFLFVDYMLVHSKNRSGGIGSKVINQLKRKNKPIILEVEPISIHEPDTRKRVRFYEKVGFRHIDTIQYTRIHPITKELNEMEIYYWSPVLKSEGWTIEKMAAVYKEVHTYQSESLYNTPPQAIQKVLILKEHVFSQAE
ncbi:GNAT family N-acetyltransferase [Domibacillus sp. 8LH]|uniref:GNAT family N-acetyltransferase n=1 Tax=Domibacillus sp. 8LH TaxID=3073900 RepID=UPI00317F5F17